MYALSDFQDIKVKQGMNLHASVDINNKNLKGVIRFIIEDTVSGETLKESDVTYNDVKAEWQNLQVSFHTKSSKIRVRLVSYGKGSLQIDNIAITSPKVVPPLQKVKWLPASDNFSIPSPMKVSVLGQSGKILKEGLSMLTRDLKKYGVVLEKTEQKNYSLQILIAKKYVIEGKGDESYSLSVNRGGITMETSQ